MLARAQLAFAQRQLHRRRDAQRPDRRQRDERRARGVEHAQRDRDEDGLQARGEDLRHEQRQRAQLVQHMGAAGKVRRRARAQVAVGQARQLDRERATQADLQAPADAQTGRRRQRLDRGQRQRQRRDDQQAGANVAVIDRSLQQRGLGDRPGGEQRDRQDERRDRDAAGRACGVQQAARGPRRRLAQRGGEVRRQTREIGRLVRQAAGSHEHRAAQEHLRAAVQRAREPRLLGQRRQCCRGILHGAQQRRRRGRSRHAAAAGQDACLRIQRRHRAAPAITSAPVISSATSRSRSPQRAQALAQRVLEGRRDRERLPRRDRDGLLMDVQPLRKPARSDDPPPGRGVHQLQPAAMAPPRHEEVRHTAGQRRDGDRRQRRRARQRDVIGGQHQLRHIEAQRARDASRALIDVPSTSVWQASRNRP